VGGRLELGQGLSVRSGRFFGAGDEQNEAGGSDQLA